MKKKIFQNKKQLFFSTFLLVIILIYSFITFNFHSVPAEDASILMRYAQHFGDGKGIVWNIGEPPLDGATDFLFTIFIGFLYKFGLSLDSSVFLITILAHFLTLIIILIGIRKFHSANNLVIAITLLFFSLGPGLRYAEAHFGTPFFAFFVALSWYFANELVSNDSNKFSIIFAVSCLFTGFARPEGVFMAAFMLVAIIYMKGFKRSKKIILDFVLIFLIVGGIYFIWRWIYFAHPLPNPFYKKGGGSLYLNGLLHSIINVIKFTFPFVPVYLMSLFSSKKNKKIIFPLIPIFFFTFIWILLSNEMNFLGRFQYPIMILVLFSWPAALNNLIHKKKLHFKSKLRILVGILLIAFFLSMFFIQFSLYKSTKNPSGGLYSVGKFLNEFKEKNYILVSTEAGLLPFYSEWRAIDPWGLNDRFIARNGIITEGYLSENNPDLIVFNAPFAPGEKEECPTSIRWYQNEKFILSWCEMALVLKNYCDENNYAEVIVLPQKYPPALSTYFYIKSNNPDKEEITKGINEIYNQN